MRGTDRARSKHEGYTATRSPLKHAASDCENENDDDSQSHSDSDGDGDGDGDGESESLSPCKSARDGPAIACRCACSPLKKVAAACWVALLYTGPPSR